MSSASWITLFPGSAYLASLLQEFLAGLLRAGPVPKHVGLVMDGNRRYAKKQNQETREGHNAGFDSLARLLSLCYSIGVNTVTIFAFSIENFKRSKYEVDNLMELTKEKLIQVCEKGDLAEKYGVRINIIGDKSLLRKDVRDMVDKAMKMTEKNNGAVLNVCFPYTSRHDIANASSRCANLASKGLISPDDITEEFLDYQMFLGDSPPLDIFVRTSGVERLSDFLIWQIHSKKKSNTSVPSSSGSNYTQGDDDETDTEPHHNLSDASSDESLASSNGSTLLEATASSTGLADKPDTIRNRRQVPEDSTSSPHPNTQSTDSENLPTETLLEFTSTLWPEFGLWEFFWVVVKWGYTGRGKLDSSYYVYNDERMDQIHKLQKVAELRRKGILNEQ